MASAYPDAGVIFNRTGWSPSTTDGGVNHLDDPLQRVLRRQPPHISGVAVRKSVHEDVRFDETMWATQDIDYLIRLAQKTQWVEIRRYLSSHGDTGPDGSAIDLESRIAGRLSLLDKHGDLIMRDPVAHSFFLARLGHQYRRAGRYKEARSSFLGALRIRPVCGVAWRGLVRVSIPPLRDA